jgi:DNA-binding NtrC family response regulator
MQYPTTLIGVSTAIRGVEDEIDLAAQSDTRVLITGECGVGKQLAARLIHQRSRRSQAPLVTSNCTGLTAARFATELFGPLPDVAGAPHDAMSCRARANGGTILIEDVGEMNLRMQALLLRFLETEGGARTAPDLPNLRVIATARRALIQQVASKRFREDLYYRLNVLHIQFPPLRDRREDVRVLLESFLQTLSETHRLPVPEVSPEALDQLTQYDWPGNVGELKHVAERLILRGANRPVGVAAVRHEISSQ